MTEGQTLFEDIVHTTIDNRAPGMRGSHDPYVAAWATVYCAERDAGKSVKDASKVAYDVVKFPQACPRGCP